MNSRPAVTLIGMSDNGCEGLTSRAINAISRAQLLVGGERHLSFFPQFPGKKIVIKGNLSDVLNEIDETAHENRVCVLTSGDPFFYGIGSLITKRIGLEFVETIQHPSSMQLAFARVGLKWNDAELLSFHGRPLSGLLTQLKRVSKVGCFTDSENSPPRIANYLIESEETGWKSWVCENLGGTQERVREFKLEELATCQDISPVNVMILQRSSRNWRPPTVVPYFSEDQFEKRMPKKGLITKREIRQLSLAALKIRNDSIVWDVGAGSGSVSIEAAILAYKGHVYAIESDSQGVAICQENLRRHQVDNVTVIEGSAPEMFEELPKPNAIFVGGSKGNLSKIIELGFGNLTPGGGLVVTAITLESVSNAYETFLKLHLVPELTVVNISRGTKLAKYLRYEALNPVHIFSIVKNEESRS